MDLCESAYIDKVITLCKQCHKKIHEKDDCKHVDMRCERKNYDKLL